MRQHLPAGRRVRLGHPNRGPHNWLLYEREGAFLRSAVPYYRGVVYDLGCGLSPYREFFLRHCTGYVGVDWAASQHDLRADLVADLDAPLPIPDCSAGTVVCLSVLEHLPHPLATLREVRRILEPGGALVLVVPFQWRVHEAPADYFRYTPFGVRALLEEARLEVLSVEPLGGYFSSAALKFNYFSRRFLDGRPRARWLRQAALLPLWTAGQCVAPMLDRRLDHAPHMEAPCYAAVARRRC